MSEATTGSENGMDCARVIQDEIAEQYVAGRLDDSDAAAFEQHYVDCARCFEELQAWRAMRVAMERATPARRPQAAIAGRWWLWPAAAAAAVLMAVVIFQSRRDDMPPQQTAAPERAPEPAAPEALTARLVELSAVTPPPYQPARLRGASDEAERQFQRAMSQYQAADHAGAAKGLESAAGLDATVPAIQFYLGICHLLTGDADHAIERLKTTVALGESAYLEEAQFHLGKAFLRKGDLAAARSAFTNTVSLDGDRKTDAQTLLRELAALESPAGGSLP